MIRQSLVPHRDAAPLAAHSRQALLAGAHLLALGALGAVGQVALLKVVRGGVLGAGLRHRLGGVVRGRLDAVGHGELHAHDVQVVVADLAADAHHVLHALAADVAELALDGLAVRPLVGHGILERKRKQGEGVQRDS